MKVLIISFLVLIFSSTLNAQTDRDTLVSEIVYNIPKDLISYKELKLNIKKLEELEEKPNPEILHSKLKYIYQQDDIEYFKEVLTLLTRNYGFNLSYASGNESYYNDIISGSLAIWFKDMYIKNHSEWLSKNLDKQIDIYRLNTLQEKDQLVNGISTAFHRSTSFTNEQKKIIEKILDEYSFDNARVILDLSTEIGFLPTGNSFSLIQKDYNYVELHNLQRVNNFDKIWESFYPYYKTSYLNKDISSIKFKAVDFTKYRHDGTQIFNLIKIDDFHESWRRNPDDSEIPIDNNEQTKKLRTELGWF
ncbi:MAG: hypothetical protein RSF68_01390 [Myroides sp.]